ncbi:hypothetical protein ACFL1R_12720, partial [Candidatus Latescibacterota bacterium]
MRFASGKPQTVMPGCTGMEVLQDIPFELDTDSLLVRLHLQKESDDAEELNALVETIRTHMRPKAVY